MIVYEHEHGDTMLESAEQAVNLANAVGHTVQLRNNDTRITIHTFTDPRAVVEQWGPTRGEYDRLARENGEQRNVIGVHEETIRAQSKLIASLRESITDVRRANGDLQERADRLAEGNAKLGYRLSSYTVASRELIDNVGPHLWTPEHAVVRLSDVNVLRMLVHTSPEPVTEADHA